MLNNHLKVFQIEGGDVYLRVLNINIEDRVCRIISFKADGTYVDGPDPVDQDEFENRLSTKYYSEVPDPLPKKFIGDTVPEKERAVRDRKFKLIEQLIIQKPDCYDKIWLKKTIAEIFDFRKNLSNQSFESSPIPGEVNLQISPAQDEFTKYEIYSSLRTYLIYGEKRNSLIPNTRYCGGKGKERKPSDNMLGRNKIYHSDVGKILTLEDKDNLKKGWHDHKVGNQANSIRDAYKDTIRQYYLNAEEFPSKMQFEYWGKKKNDPVKSAKKAAGTINWNKDKRVLTSGARVGIFGPGSQAQIDSTKDDTHVLSMVIPNTYIGRLTLFLLVDTYSAMPMGIALVPENSSHYSTCLALINAATDKVKFCAEHGIPIKPTQWPVRHLPARILGDLGILFGEKSDSVTDLEIMVSNTGVFRADMKPIVERYIGKLLAGIKGVLADHGLVNKKDSPRTSDDTREQAVLDYKSLMAVMIEQILYFINHEPIAKYPLTDEMKRESLRPTPINLWNFGIRKGYDALQPEDSEELAIKLFEKEECSYDRQGIVFLEDRYMCATKEGKAFYDQLVFGEKPEHLIVKYNPMNTNQIYLSHRGEFFKLYRMAGDLKVQTFVEVAEDIFKYRALHAATEGDRIQAGARTKQNQRDIIDKAKKKRGKGEIDVNNTRPAMNQEREHHRKTAIPEKKVTVDLPTEDTKSIKESFKLPDLLLDFDDE